MLDADDVAVVVVTKKNLNKLNSTNLTELNYTITSLF